MKKEWETVVMVLVLIAILTIANTIMLFVLYDRLNEELLIRKNSQPFTKEHVNPHSPTGKFISLNSAD